MLFMGKKKLFLLLFSLVFMSLLSGLAFATHTSSHQSFLPEIIEDVAQFLFLDLGTFTETAPDTFILYSKFIFFILVFSIFYWGASKAFKDNMRIGGVIAFIFALIGTVLLPGEFMIFIFETYSQVIGFAFGILPFVIGLMISHMVFKGEETWQRILRGIVYVLMGVFTFALVGTLRGFEDTLYIELAQWAEIGAFIAILIGIFVLIGSIGGGSGTGGNGGISDILNRISNKENNGKNKDGDGTDDEEKKAKEEEKKAEEEEAKTDKEEMKKIRDLIKVQLKFLNDLKKLDINFKLNAKLSRLSFIEWLKIIEFMEKGIEALEKLEIKEIKLEHLREEWLTRYASNADEKKKILIELIKKEKNVLLHLADIVKELKKIMKVAEESDEEFISPEIKKYTKSLINRARGLTGLLMEVNKEEMLKLISKS